MPSLVLQLLLHLINVFIFLIIWDIVESLHDIGLLKSEVGQILVENLNLINLMQTHLILLTKFINWLVDLCDLVQALAQDCLYLDLVILKLIS